MAKLGTSKAGGFKSLGKNDLSVVSTSAKLLTPGTKTGKKCGMPKGFGR